VAKRPAPNGPPHGGLDFSKSQPDPDPPRSTYVLARQLVPGDRIMVRCTQPSTGMLFDEDRTVARATNERGRVYVQLEPKPDSQDAFDVPLDHRFVAVKVANPIKIKGR
jgi:hypothetical protein